MESSSRARRGDMQTTGGLVVASRSQARPQRRPGFFEPPSERKSASASRTADHLPNRDRGGRAARQSRLLSSRGRNPAAGGCGRRSSTPQFATAQPCGSTKRCSGSTSSPAGRPSPPTATRSRPTASSWPPARGCRPCWRRTRHPVSRCGARCCTGFARTRRRSMRRNGCPSSSGCTARATRRSTACRWPTPTPASRSRPSRRSRRPLPRPSTGA